MVSNQVTLLPEVVLVKLETLRVAARIEVPQVPVPSETRDVPVLLVPGKPGPPGKDGAVVGGAVIDDSTPKLNRVWSSQHTYDQDNATIESLTPEIDLTILFNNALT